MMRKIASHGSPSRKITVPFGYSESEELARRRLRVKVGTSAKSGCSLKTLVSIFIADNLEGVGGGFLAKRPVSFVQLATVAGLHLKQRAG
jgi:hypothetical protein